MTRHLLFPQVLPNLLLLQKSHYAMISHTEADILERGGKTPHIVDKCCVLQRCVERDTDSWREGRDEGGEGWRDELTENVQTVCGEESVHLRCTHTQRLAQTDPWQTV